MSTSADRILFREEQRFRQPWLWAVVAASWLTMLAVAAWALWQPSAQITPAGKVLVLTIVLALQALGGLALYFMRLSVWVEPDALRVHFRPLRRKRIPLAEVVRCEARSYRPLLEYGGWGIRYSVSRGWAYNVSGHQGVQLELTGGKRILIGSQRPQELANAINDARSAPPGESPVP